MTIVIKNLPFSVSEAELKELFAPYGAVQVTLIAQVQIESDDSQVEWKAVEALGTIALRGQSLQLDLADDSADAFSGAIAFPSPDPLEAEQSTLKRQLIKEGKIKPPLLQGFIVA